MPIKSTRFKVTIDEGSKSFLLSFVSESGSSADPNERRHITLHTWDQVQATAELARRGKLETDAEVSQRSSQGREPKLSTESIESYIERGGVITKVRQVGKEAPRPDDKEGWDDLLSDLFISEVTPEYADNAEFNQAPQKKAKA